MMTTTGDGAAECAAILTDFLEFVSFKLFLTIKKSSQVSITAKGNGNKIGYFLLQPPPPLHSPKQFHTLVLKRLWPRFKDKGI